MASVKSRARSKKPVPTKSRPPGRKPVRLKKVGLNSVIKAAAKVSRNGKAHPPKGKPAPHDRRSTARPQRAAARDTSAITAAEEQVERAKFDIGVPTKDLSTRLPKTLPQGYGKDRIVV